MTEERLNMRPLRDPLRTEDFSDLDSASRVALAQQLESMAEWNRAMALFVADYQLDVIASFRAALANKWRRLWVMFAFEGCLSLVVIVIALFSMGLLMAIVMTSH